MFSPSEHRQQTPGVPGKIHFNNAGASLMPSVVINEIHRYIELESKIGGYEAADSEVQAISRFYDSFAALLNVAPRNIAYTSSATDSYARALSSIPFEKNDAVVIAQEDYISNQLAFLSLQQRYQIRLLRANSRPEGGVDVDDVERLIKLHSPRLISLSHVPSNTGLIQPAEQLGDLCEKYDILYLLDACQSIGQLPVDVSKLKCDFLCATMRKFLRGPRGAGFLFVSDKVLQQQLYPMFVDLRGAAWTSEDRFELREDAKRFEEGEVPYALMLGATRAAEYAMSVGLQNIAERNRHLCDIIRSGIENIGLRLLDVGNNLSSIITLEVPGIEPLQLLSALRRKDINTSVSYRNFALPDFKAKNVDWALRISPHHYNTEEEAESLLEALTDFREVEV